MCWNFTLRCSSILIGNKVSFHRLKRADKTNQIQLNSVDLSIYYAFMDEWITSIAKISINKLPSRHTGVFPKVLVSTIFHFQILEIGSCKYKFLLINHKIPANYSCYKIIKIVEGAERVG